MEARVALTLKVVSNLSTAAIGAGLPDVREHHGPAAPARQAARSPTPASRTASRRPRRCRNGSTASSRSIYLVFTEGYADHGRRPRGRGDPARSAARRADAGLRRGARAARADAAPACPPGRPRRRRRARHARGPGPLALGHRRDQRGALPDRRAGDGRGAYRVQAELAAVHATALDAASTDWLRIVALYDELLAIHPSPIVALNRAVAVGMSDGPLAGSARPSMRSAPELPDSTSSRRLGRAAGPRRATVGRRGTSSTGRSRSPRPTRSDASSPAGATSSSERRTERSASGVAGRHRRRPLRRQRGRRTLIDRSRRRRSM